MGHKIRQLMHGEGCMLTGVIEADETFIGGKISNMQKSKRKATKANDCNKTAVAGILQRGGKIKAKVVESVKTETLMPNLLMNVERGAMVFTDELGAYNTISKNGYYHFRVSHTAGEYVRGSVHTNSIEGFWSQLKRSINGTFHHVSRQHLQKYVNEFVYRYNLRRSEQPIFSDLSSRVSEQHA